MAMIFPGGWEVIVIAGVVLVLFGASAIPKFAKSIGKAKREFEKGIEEGGHGNPDQLEAPEAATEPTQTAKRSKARREPQS
jgi:sec-independent protein translocase protein TatA